MGDWYWIGALLGVGVGLGVLFAGILAGFRAALTAVAAAAVFVLIPADVARGEQRETWRQTFAGVAAAVRVRSFWPIFLAHATYYAIFATVIGLWAGPWLSDVHVADLETGGRLLLVGAVAQISGVFVLWYLDRFFRSYRRSVLLAASSTAAILMVGAVVPLTLTGAAVWLALLGFAVGYGPIVTAHGKSLFPPELTGRGITLMNMGTMSGVFFFQSATGVLVDLFGRTPQGGYPAEAYRAVFFVLALGLVASLIPYARAIDPHPSRSHERYAKG